MMSDGLLSQEEIDALLKGDSNNEAVSDNQNDYINDFEKDAIGEIGNISMGTSATTLSTLLNRKVSITTPKICITKKENLQSDYPLPCLIIEVKYTEGINGSNVLIIKSEDASVIADLMMGGDGSSRISDIDEIQLSAVSEAMNQMMGSATTSLSSMFNQKIDISPPDVREIDLARHNLDLYSDDEEIVQIKFNMVIEDLVNSEIMQIVSIEAAKNMVGNLMGTTVEESATLNSIVQTAEPEPVKEEIIQPTPAENTSEKMVAVQDWDTPSLTPTSLNKSEQFAVQPVQFAPLQENNVGTVPNNIGLIMDVPLDVVVELGKTRKTIKEVLELSQGSIIQLDKLAGEPVDLLVNGKLIARGEVVVIDENYGIRITNILSPMDRMNKLQ